MTSIAPHPPAVSSAGRRSATSSGRRSSDYAYEREEGDDAIPTSRYPCRCGAVRCRGTILAPPD